MKCCSKPKHVDPHAGLAKRVESILAISETLGLQGFYKDLFWQAKLFGPLISFFL